MKPSSIQFFRVVVAGAAVLILAGAVSKILECGLGHDYAWGYVPLFDLNTEKNVPTWFSSALLLSCAFVLWRIADKATQAHEPVAGRWRLLSLGFIYLSMDETAMLHEHMGNFFRAHFPTGGWLYYSWVFFMGLPVALFLAVYFFNFLKRLPRRTMILFILAGSVFLSGALGLEVVGGWLDYNGARDSAGYGICSFIEEVLELSGMLIFLGGALSFYDHT
jgi:hypothetical protein